MNLSTYVQTLQRQKEQFIFTGNRPKRRVLPQHVDKQTFKKEPILVRPIHFIMYCILYVYIFYPYRNSVQRNNNRGVFETTGYLLCPSKEQKNVKFSIYRKLYTCDLNRYVHVRIQKQNDTLTLKNNHYISLK